MHVLFVCGIVETKWSDRERKCLHEIMLAFLQFTATSASAITANNNNNNNKTIWCSIKSFWCCSSTMWSAFLSQSIPLRQTHTDHGTLGHIANIILIDPLPCTHHRTHTTCTKDPFSQHHQFNCTSLGGWLTGWCRTKFRLLKCATAQNHSQITINWIQNKRKCLQWGMIH